MCSMQDSKSVGGMPVHYLIKMFTQERTDTMGEAEEVVIIQSANMQPGQTPCMF